ncbi:NPCBM/NEW2 domain-containing protein, partial [Blautia wexlerae]|nr:NPCBM/NEW2 domain-containing protein [Blautia wexlerae]
DAGYVGFNGGFSENDKRAGDMFSAVASCSQITGAGWGLAHELGHLLEGSRVGRAEYTNNLFSLQFQNEFQVSNRVSARFREEILKYNNSDYKLEERPGYIGGNFVLLAILYQLEAAYGDHGSAFSADSVYAKTLRWSRDNGGRLGGLENGDTLYMNRFAVAASNALGIDLTNHFEHYGIEITDAARKQLDPDLKPNTKKTWLATSAADAKDVQTLPDGSVPTVKLSRENGLAVLRMDVPEAPAGAVQTYEILRDGELAGYALAGNASNIPVSFPSNRVTWIDSGSNDGADHSYTVRAYDARLNESGDSEPAVFSADAPYIVMDGVNVLMIHQEFDPLSVVTAHSVDGQDLTDSIRVIDNNLDVDVRGNYTITYAVTDEAGRETTLEVPFGVISNYVYASDVSEQSAKVGYGTLNHDANIQGGVITLLEDGRQVTFAKGLGAHASSEIIYDLTDTGFSWFESYVGIDQSMRNSSLPQAKFQVFVDGELRYDSGAMKSNTPMKYVSVDLTGAKQLRLVTDSMGSNSNDHTVWGGARFTTGNAVPVIHAQDLVFTDPADVDLDEILSSVTATDAEDGDITSALTYTTNF